MEEVEGTEFHVRPVRGVLLVLATMGLSATLVGVAGFGNFIGTAPGVVVLLVAGHLGFRLNQQLS